MYFWCICGVEGGLCVLPFRHLEAPPGTIIFFSILQIRKPRHRGAKQHAQDKMINKWHDHNSSHIPESQLEAQFLRLMLFLCYSQSADLTLYSVTSSLFCWSLEVLFESINNWRIRYQSLLSRPHHTLWFWLKSPRMRESLYPNMTYIFLFLNSFVNQH